MSSITKSYVSSYFERRYRKLPREIQRIAKKKIFLFEGNPFHPSLKTHKLKGALISYWSFYATKDVRVLFRFLNHNEVIYYDIGTHDIYR